MGVKVSSLAPLVEATVYGIEHGSTLEFLSHELLDGIEWLATKGQESEIIQS